MVIPLIPAVLGALGVINVQPRRSRLRREAPQAEGRIDFRRLIRDVVKALFSADQQKLQGEMTPADLEAAEAAQRKSRRQMQISAGVMGLAATASFVPVLVPAAAAGVLYLMRDTFRLVWRDIKRGHYLSVYLIGAGMCLTMIATGHILLAAFASFMEGFFARIINQLEETSQTRLANVFRAHPAHVWVVKDGVEVEVAFSDLQQGDLVRIHAGEVVPADGRIVSGDGQVDQRILTGESEPVEKEPGDEVFAATLLLSGQITVGVAGAGDDTVAAKISHALNETQHYKDTVMLRGREISDKFIPVKLSIAAGTTALMGFNSGLAVMWAEMGEGMSVSGPMAVMSYLQLLAEHQILVKDGRAFEALNAVDTIVFDKTGTLTEEQPTLGRVHAFGGFDSAEVLALAAAAESRQPHPIAHAIRARAEAEGLVIPPLEDASYEVGFGVKVRVGGRAVRVGSARFLGREGITLPESLAEIQATAEAASHSLIYLAVDDAPAGMLEMEPTIRPEARGIIESLKARGLDLYIISGDHDAPTRRMAEELGIPNYFAEVLPEGKAALVQQLRDEGRFVCFIGDGINDAIALKTAQASISLKGASTAATDTAQIIFMDGTLRNLHRVFGLVDEFEHTMRRNMVFSFAPGVLVIGGVLFFNFGVGIALAVQYASIFGELANVFWPLARHQKALPPAADAAHSPHPRPDHTYGERIMKDIFRQKTEHAAQVLAPVIRQTPLTLSAPLGELIGGQVWLKQENLQKTGCCKARSAYYMLASLSEAERRHVVTVSTGNNGVAMSWAMAALGIPGTVFLPHTVVPHKVRVIAENKVTIIREGQDIVDAEIVARAYAAEHGYTFRSPYNEWEAMYAQATIGKEIVEELDASGEAPDTLLVPVGGGGLIGGIAAYLRSIGREMKIVGVQPANSAVMALSVRAGRILNVLSLPTLSDATAGGVEQGAITYDFCRDQVDDYMVFSEEEIAEAMLYIHDRHGIIVEGAGALSIAALLQNPERFRGRKVALLLCGANVDSALLQRLRSAA